MSASLMLYDGDCGMCARVAAGLGGRGDVAWRPWQQEATLPAGVTAETLARGVALVLPDGRVRHGYDAFRALGWRVGWLLPLALFGGLPGVRFLGRAAYGLVARHRAAISRRLGLAACRLGVALLAVLGTLGVVGAAGTAHAEAPMPFARADDDFAVVVDTRGAAGAAIAGGMDALEETWLARGGAWPDAEVAIWFTTRRDEAVLGLYRPIANDVAGIGSPLFDQSADDTVGIVYGNALDLYAEYPTLLPLVMLQELGHRWCCYLREDAGDLADATELLGRTDGHWSYFLDSDASPMEGNDWRWDGADAFTSETAARWQETAFVRPFSPLDLYVMGLVPSPEVPPFFLIDAADAGGQLDLYGQPITAASPPELAAALTVHGARRALTIDDVLRANGPRVPAAWDGNYRVAFVLLVQPGEEDDPTARAAMTASVGEVTALWATATGGRSRLVNVTTANAPAIGPATPVLDETTEMAPGGCQVGGRPFTSGGAALTLGLMALGLMAFALRRRQPQEDRCATAS